MRRMTRTVVSAVAVAAVGATMAVPAFAAGWGNGPGNGAGNGDRSTCQAANGDCTGHNLARGNAGKGMNGGRFGGGQAGAQHEQRLAGVASGTLTTEQKADLAYMAEEEKLARDVYTALAAKFGSTPAFTRIAQSEQRHLDAVRSLLVRYDIADPTAGKAAGEFASSDIAAMYRQFSSASTLAAAIDAGIAIEKDDLAELATAAASVDAPDVEMVYENLAKGSRQHLSAFERLA